MNKKIVFAIFAIVILAVPMYIMFSSEDVLEHGNRHKLRLRGYDPVDPFRGKYIRLNYDNMVEGDAELDEGDECYVTLDKDSAGWSSFSYAHSVRPDHHDYFTTVVTDVYDGQFFIDFNNMSKYFINEDKAKLAEDYVINYRAQRPDDIYVAIRVLDGEVRLEDIFIEETPLLEFLDQKEIE